MKHWEKQNFFMGDRKVCYQRTCRQMSDYFLVQGAIGVRKTAF
ncbi:MAG: hypothetical protein OXE77_02980 [Flavobacteriaceae bacterium]|nr:hypothetical protein [Flavobacteriaceae bacterium]MCY4268475.1 hypothetical protein [Flavobacteriaceae bacterium]